MSRLKDALKKVKAGRERPAPSGGADMPNVQPEFGPSKTRILNYCEEAVARHKVLTPYFEDRNISERFKLLRTKIITATQKNDDRNILVTSTLDREGKTFVALNLAITFAREVDQTVLLVDGNLKNPSVLKMFGIQAEQGLTDYLLYDRPLSELLVRPGIEKLVVLPSGRPVEHSAELLRSIKMQNLVKEMKSRYSDRYVFFDASSVLAGVDTIVLSNYVDKMLFVVEEGRVPAQRITEAVELLNQEKIFGTVFNKKS